MEDSQHLELVNHLKDHLVPTAELEDLVSLFKSLGDLTRLRIILALAQTTLSVSELTDILGMSQSTISHQLGLLKQMNLVKGTRSGKNIHYRLADDHILTIVGTVKAHVEEQHK